MKLKVTIDRARGSDQDYMQVMSGVIDEWKDIDE